MQTGTLECHNKIEHIQSCHGKTYILSKTRVVQWLSGRALDLWSLGYGFWFPPGAACQVGQVVHTYVTLSSSSITWYRSKDSDVLRRGRWPQAWRKVMAAYRRGWLKKSPAGWLPVYNDELWAQRSETTMGEFSLENVIKQWWQYYIWPAMCYMPQWQRVKINRLDKSFVMYRQYRAQA